MELNNNGLKPAQSEVAGKICCRCNVWQPLTSFNKDPHVKSGKQGACKSCVSLFHKSLNKRLKSIIYLDTDTKVCACCGKEKVLTEFRKRYDEVKGRAKNCNICVTQLKFGFRLRDVGDIQEKQCSKCGKWKTFDNYKKTKAHLGGISNICRVCDKEYRSQDHVKQTQLRATNNWVANNPDKVRANAKNRYHNNPTVRLNTAFSVSVNSALNGKKNRNSWQKLVGYTSKQLRDHLESQFQEGMTWDNFGSYWHVDHIIAKAHFFYTTWTDPEFKLCWGLHNLRPLPKIENIKKGARLFATTTLPDDHPVLVSQNTKQAA